MGVNVKQCIKCG